MSLILISFHPGHCISKVERNISARKYTKSNYFGNLEKEKSEPGKSILPKFIKINKLQMILNNTEY